MLTDSEKTLINEIGFVMNGFHKIAKEALEENPNLAPYDGDLVELCTIIHQLQNWVLSNSAARSHPEEFRPYGCIFKNKAVK